LIPTLIDVNYDDKWIDGFISFKGSPCAAGKDYVVIDLNGEVYRCHTEKKHLGNIYKGGFNLLPEKQPCIAQVCSCPYFGFKFATGNPTLIKMNHDEWIAFKENKKIVTLR